jgi:hypothetical protein
LSCPNTATDAPQHTKLLVKHAHIQTSLKPTLGLRIQPVSTRRSQNLHSASLDNYWFYAQKLGELLVKHTNTYPKLGEADPGGLGARAPRNPPSFASVGFAPENQTSGFVGTPIKADEKNLARSGEYIDKGDVVV